jgi:uncharacterized protein (UPF0261 family)
MEKKIIMLGCFDTKGEDFSYLYSCLLAYGAELITINTGVMDSSVDFPIDFDSKFVAESSGVPLDIIRGSNDRGKAVELMGKGAATIISELVLKNQIKGAIGMGGGGGTYMALAAIQKVPLGVPKLCLSTITAIDLSRQIGVKDISLMSSVVDVAGLNNISRLLIKQAAASICAMANVIAEPKDISKKSIAISIFGNTTKCVDKCSELLKEKGFEVLVFHATGVGGKTMESLIREGAFDAVLDVTTTELADELYNGILSAGPNRLTAASELGIPQIVVPGCLDMVNFGHIDTVPSKYRSRQLYSWSPEVTLMRTNKEENESLGKHLADKLNKAKGLVEIALPLKGISQLDNEGDIFYNREIDTALFKSIKENAIEIPITEIEAHINDEAFAAHLVARLIKLIE